MKTKYKEGTLLKIINPGEGAYHIKGYEGRVVSKEYVRKTYPYGEDYSLYLDWIVDEFNKDTTMCIEVTEAIHIDNEIYREEGSIWVIRVDEDDSRYEIVTETDLDLRNLSAVVDSLSEVKAILNNELSDEGKALLLNRYEGNILSVVNGLIDSCNKTKKGL